MVDKMSLVIKLFETRDLETGFVDCCFFKQLRGEDSLIYLHVESLLNADQNTTNRSKCTVFRDVRGQNISSRFEAPSLKACPQLDVCTT